MLLKKYKFVGTKFYFLQNANKMLIYDHKLLIFAHKILVSAKEIPICYHKYSIWVIFFNCHVQSPMVLKSITVYLPDADFSS